MKAKVYPVENAGKLLATASVEIEGIVIKGFKIVKGEYGGFVSWPSQKGKDGKYYDQVYALDGDTRSAVNVCILDEFNDEMDNRKRGRGRR